MATEFCVMYAPTNSRSKLIAHAMKIGLTAMKERVSTLSAANYHEPIADVAIFYGMADGLRKAFDDYVAAGLKAVYVDLGYWCRMVNGRSDGYYKVSVNSRHPTAYFQNIKHNDHRARALGLKIKEPKGRGEFIMVAGMSGKAAEFEGFAPEEWESGAIDQLSGCGMDVVYRPKPSWAQSTDLTGEATQRTWNIADGLMGCHGVATHHSNVAVDALIEGIPVYCEEGVASVLSTPSIISLASTSGNQFLDKVDRHQWLSDVAHCQFSLSEMKRGAAIRHLLDDGVI